MPCSVSSHWQEVHSRSDQSGWQAACRCRAVSLTSRNIANVLAHGLCNLQLGILATWKALQHRVRAAPVLLVLDFCLWLANILQQSQQV